MTEFKEEYINRELACYFLNKFASADNQPRAIRRAAKFVATLPKSDVRRVVKGKWEDCSNGWMCSVCKTDHEKDSKYCPNCGAYMQAANTQEAEEYAQDG